MNMEASSTWNPEQIEQRKLEESVGQNTTENFVTCIHRAKLAGNFRDIMVTWSKTLIGHSLIIMVEENPCEGTQSTCKIDLKTWQFWGKKGLKSFKVDEKRVDVYWDLRSAKFSTCSPEPSSGYYVALVSDKELILFLGDQKKEAYSRTKCRPSSMDAALVHKKENVFAKKCFCTRTMLGEGKREHHIIIESSINPGPYDDPEMWISVDGIESVRVSNLHWRFRGNETLVVDGIPVQIFWDVHDWLYNNDDESVSGPGTFIFMQGNINRDEEVDEDYSVGRRRRSNPNCDGVDFDYQVITAEFCHFLYAWKTE
ncbi:OLC1v1022402C1 [Oldenlandia corymbosa var. corymbosa]|uniref:OLC1v1022402C1 n=1 Tax=Oldenlandia corymbosa var. corymbosa TaxID=529605 RepID=A0AAV1C057_OLDCO|nr:OLC1v1022402C1 [Oldenlandia corymbosa var. corymbosa]